MTRLILLILLTTIVLPLPARAYAAEDGLPGGPTAVDIIPAWMEPRGISIVDLVGVVPEEQLRDAIIRYWPGHSLTLYKWGRRDGDTVTIRVRYLMQWDGTAFCLGKPGEDDQWPVAVPESRMRLYENGVDITRRLTRDFYYFPAGFLHPYRPSGGFRYTEYKGEVRFDPSGAVIVPANTGCSFYAYPAGSNLEAEFTFYAPQVILLDLLGSQSKMVHSYIGPGAAGLLDSLRDQMQSRYGNRHEDFRVSPPAEANYMLVRYPLTPVDPYGHSPYHPGAGTYRVRRSGSRLSVDYTNTMGIPYFGQWQDADQSGGADYLPHFKDSVAVSSPEYFVPPGIAYDPCMTNGNCAAALLEAIYRAEMPLTVYFFRVQTIARDLHAIPLKMVGPGWSPSATTAAMASAIPNASHRIYMPTAFSPIPPAGYGGANCPCGVFTADGRMVNYIPGPP